MLRIYLEYTDLTKRSIHLEFLYEYGLFFAKTITFVIAIGIIVAIIAGASSKSKPEKGELTITNLSDKLDQQQQALYSNTLSKEDFKAFEKEIKKRDKEADTKPSVFVINFKGSVDAKEVESLRNEVTAVLQVAKNDDEVVVKLESGGGVVHGYGLAASQLARIKDANLNLTICVDKVAASGGYMMACLADKVICAPFAIVGSIGVIAQIPNFNKILKKNDVEFEQITAGEYKRTLTMFGENTDAGRDKFKQEIEQVHHLFSQHVSKARPRLDVEKVATGETWFGHDALELGLVDQISTSDDVLLNFNKTHGLFEIKYQSKKGLPEKLGLGMAAGVESLVNKFVSRSNDLIH